ncbi:MAG: glycosyltransferase family 4 protein [Bacteroidia bacterium]
MIAFSGFNWEFGIVGLGLGGGVGPWFFAYFGAMRIAILSDPRNFHTQKWALALQATGAEVVVMSYDPVPTNAAFHAIQLMPRSGVPGKYNYMDYVRGGKVLQDALVAERIEVVNPLNITPLGVWAMQSGFHPVVACAFGADILEYPPSGKGPAGIGRGWEATALNPGRWDRWKAALKRRYFRRKVAQALGYADFVTGDNQYLVDCMADWFGTDQGKMAVLRWGVEPELFEAAVQGLEQVRRRFGIEPGQKVVLSPRGMKPIYQADIILEAFEELLRAGRSDAHFIMLGAGYQVAPEVSNCAQKLAKTFRNFRFETEAVSREEMHALWLMTDVFISAPVYDGYSAALAEGRFVGAIPIVNDIPANRELIRHGDNGWICKPFAPTSLVHDLAQVLDHVTELRAKFAPVNRVWVTQHSLMSANARRFLELVQERVL